MALQLPTIIIGVDLLQVMSDELDRNASPHAKALPD
jgi:hypothetical protein